MGSNLRLHGRSGKYDVSYTRCQCPFVYDSLLTICRYGCSSVSREDLVTVAESTMTELLQWKTDLPPDLRIDLNDAGAGYLPHLILLQ